MNRWISLDSVGSDWFAELIPAYDTRPHANSKNCSCGTKVYPDGVLVHSGFDGREFKYSPQLQLTEI